MNTLAIVISNSHTYILDTKYFFWASSYFPITLERSWILCIFGTFCQWKNRQPNFWREQGRLCKCLQNRMGYRRQPMSYEGLREMENIGGWTQLYGDVPSSKTGNVRKNQHDILGRKADHYLHCQCVHREKTTKLQVTSCGELVLWVLIRLLGY